MLAQKVASRTGCDDLDRRPAIRLGSGKSGQQHAAHITPVLALITCLILGSASGDTTGGGVRDLVASALAYIGDNHPPSYTPARSSPTPPEVASFASVQAPQSSIRQSPPSDGLPSCANLPRFQKLGGSWVDHPDADYRGEYDMTADCPSFVVDYDCRRPDPAGKVDPDFIMAEYRKVFQPSGCSLRQLDAAAFASAFAGRRIFMLGDSLMRLHFYSMACLLRAYIKSGSASVWDKSSIRWKGDYWADWGDAKTQVVKQFVGDFDFGSGASVHLRDFGVYNQSLYDDLLSDFQPLRDTDVLVVNWGAWYPRFSWNQKEVGWQAWQKHIYQLFTERLSKFPGQVYWKQYAPAHFGGATGTDTNVDNQLPGGPWRYKCWPANQGEFWYDDYVQSLLTGPCKDACARVKILPIYNMTLLRYNSHHGSMGRGVSEGQCDCRHWCNNVVDWWSILLMNLIGW